MRCLVASSSSSVFRSSIPRSSSYRSLHSASTPRTTDGASPPSAVSGGGALHLAFVSSYPCRRFRGERGGAGRSNAGSDARAAAVHGLGGSSKFSSRLPCDARGDGGAFPLAMVALASSDYAGSVAMRPGDETFVSRCLSEKTQPRTRSATTWRASASHPPSRPRPSRVSRVDPVPPPRRDPRARSRSPPRPPPRRTTRRSSPNPRGRRSATRSPRRRASRSAGPRAAARRHRRASGSGPSTGTPSCTTRSTPRPSPRRRTPSSTPRDA